MTSPLTVFFALSDRYIEAQRTNDWRGVALALDEDAILSCSAGFEGGGVYEGREAVLFFFVAREYFVTRHFERWTLDGLAFPVIRERTVSAPVLVGLAARGSPDLSATFELKVLTGEEAVLEIEEDWPADSRDKFSAHLAAYGPALSVRSDLFDLAPCAELQLLNLAMQRTERFVRSRNAIGSVADPSTLGEPAEVYCRTTWVAPGLPELTLEHALRCRFPDRNKADVQEHWEPDQREQRDAYLSAHGAVLRKRALARKES